MRNKKLNIYFMNENFMIFFRKNNLKEMMDLNAIANKQSRPYVGFVGIEINGMQYAIPLTHNESNSYKPHHKYSILIPDENGNKLGILKINKMLPILNDNNFIENIDINNCSKKLINDLMTELEYLNQPHIYDKVHQLANEIYEHRYNATEQELEKDTNLKFAVDFKQAEILMYKYAFELYDNNLLEEEPLIPKHIANESLHEFSELKKYCEENNINSENKHIIYESEVYQIELLRHNNGDLELVEEIWDGTEEDEEGNTLYVRPFINTLNGICKTWTYEEIRSLTKQELMDEIKQNLRWFECEYLDEDEYELEEFYESLSNFLDKWANENSCSLSKTKISAKDLDQAANNNSAENNNENNLKKQNSNSSQKR